MNKISIKYITVLFIAIFVWNIGCSGGGGGSSKSSKATVNLEFDSTTDTSITLDENETTIVLKAILSSEATEDITVNFNTTTGTAGSPADYTISGSVIIPTGQTSATFDLNIKEDISPESDETVIIAIDSVDEDKATVSDDQLTVTIKNEDFPTVSFTAASQSSSNESGTMTITAQLSQVWTSDVTVPFSVSGTSTAVGGGTDYTITATPIVISANNTSEVITITLADDSIHEENETVVVNMGTPTNAVAGAITSHTATITDDEATPTVSFTSASQVSSDETETLTITAELSGVSSKNVIVPFSIDGVDTTATGGGSDYIITSSPIAISAGTLTSAITVEIQDDILDEENEIIKINMGTPTGADQGATTSHEITITDDDVLPTVTFTSASQSSINESGTLTVTAQLSAVSSKSITVPFTVSGGTATGGGTDYSITASPLTISPGSSSADIIISISMDTEDDDLETVIIDMDNPTNANKGAITSHTATITDDDDQPTVNFTSTSQTSGAESGNMVITAQLSNTSGSDITVPFTIDGASTATGGGTDYSITATPITISAGLTTGDITISISADILNENDETVIVNMGTPTNANKGSDVTHTATITDDDSEPTVTFTSASQSSVNESGVMTITAQLSVASGKDVTVPFSVNGSSTATGSGTDYTITATPLTIPAGSTSADISITIVSDLLDEDGETVVVDMGTPTNATESGTTSHTATIDDDDDTPTVAFTSSSQSSTNESGSMIISAEISAVSGQDVTVPFTVNGSSTATGGGADYTITSSPITIPAGSTSADITISITSDLVDELNETIIVDMGTPVNATQGAIISHTATIDDDDATPTVSFTSDSQSSTNETGTMTITAQLSTASGLDVTIPFTVNGSSSATGGGTDYSITATPITISPGSTTEDITISIVTDTLDEIGETVIVDMGTPTNATQGAIVSHTATIDDDDETPTVVFTSSSQSSTNETGAMTVTAQLTAASGLDVTVPFSIHGASTATGGGTDYSVSSTPVTISAGSTSGIITITLNDDSLDENDESVIVVMGSPTNATQGGTTSHTATIKDDDDTPTVTFTSPSQTSTNESGTLSITAQLSAVSGLNVTVPFTVAGTATGSGTDYNITSSPVVIAAGSSSTDIDITIIIDTSDELDETVIVNMGSPTNATQGGTTSHTATITDDDALPTVAFTTSSQTSSNESSTMTIIAQLSETSGLDVEIPFTIDGLSTATGSGTDYSISASPITIPFGSTTANITITITGDSLDEDNETVIVNMGTPTNANKGAIDVHTGTITDDDVTPSVFFTASSQNSTNESGSMTITAQLSAVSGRDITLPFNLNGSSTATGSGTDYSLSATPVTISAGSVSGDITVTISDDSLDEIDETVIIDMDTPTNAVLGATTSHTAIITDDDDGPTVSLAISGTPFIENGGSAQVDATLSTISAKDVTINLTYGGSATLTDDYTRTGTSIVVPAGSTTGSVIITGVNDSVTEIGDETVVVDIDTVINGTESGTQQVTAVIDEPAVVSNITSSTPDGFYKAGSDISIQIEFSEPVDVNITGGIPSLTLEAGASDPEAGYDTGTGSDTLTFNYTVISGENSLDLDSASTTALLLNGGTIVDSTGNNAILTVPVGSGTMGALANNKTIRIDTDVPSIIDVSSSTSSGTYGLSSTISVNVYFSDDFTDDIVVTGTPTLTLETGSTDAIVDYTSVSGKILTFDYTVLNGHTSADLDYQAINSLLLNSGTIKDQAGNSANIILPTPGLASSLSSNRDIVIDGEVPIVLSVNSATADGAYMAGETVSIQVNFSHSVSVTGTPTLTLNSGATVDFTSGDGSSTLVFDYTISGGESASDLDYTAINSLTGTIKKTGGASNDAVLTLPVPGNAGSLASNSAIEIDTTVPTIDSITSTTLDGTYGETSDINVTVTLDEAVTLSGGTLDVELDTGDIVSVSAGLYPATVLTGTYTVGSGDNSVDLDSVDITLNGGGTLVDAAGNDTDLTLPGTTIANGSAIVIDTSIPTISSITSSKPDGSYGNLVDINVTVTFSEEVTLAGGGTLDVTLDTGDIIPVSAGVYPATVLTGTYTVSAADNSSDLDSTGIALSGATLKGGPTGAGNDANLTMPVTTIATGSNIIIDTVAPVINSITSATADGTYGESSNINVTVTLNEPVTLAGGTFDVTLETGATDDLISVSAGVYPATVLTGTYSVGPGDTSSDLNSTAVALNGGGTLTDAAGNSADLSMPGTTIATGSEIVIDTTPLSVEFTATSSGNGENVNSIDLQIELSSTSGSDVTVDYSANGASTAAGSGTDYTLIGSGTATITAGATTANISLTINNDTIDENNETIIVDLTNPGGGASLGTNTSHTYTITDDDDPPTVSFDLASDASVDESASGSTVSVSLSSESGKNVSVTLTDSGGTATSVTDYDLGGGSPQVISFTPGQVTQNVTITPEVDVVDEGSGETVVLGLSAPSNASLGAITTHTFTITDDDGTPTLAIQDVSVNENSGTATVNVNLAGSSGSIVSVDYSTVNGTADGSDYISASGTLNWPASSTGIQSFTVTISDDSFGETSETVILNINNPANATIVDASGVMTIVDNDTTLVITSAETLDVDPVDGYIDHYKITFSESVTDSTFDGYTENDEGALTSKWNVAGYNNIRLDHGTAYSDGITDIADDNIIYIKFDQGGSNDTGQVPELTSTAATITGSSGQLYYGTGNVLVLDVTEVDSAKPYIWSAFAENNGGVDGSAGVNDTLQIRYSESTNAADITGLDIDTIIELNNGNDFGDSSDITSAVWSSTNFADDTLTLTFDTDNPTAYDGDSIKAIGTSVLDLNNNSPENPSKVLSPPIITGTFDSGAIGPVIISAEYLDSDTNGFIDHVKITFDKNVDESTFPGYVGDNQLNDVTAAWQVNGYNNVALDSTDTLDADPVDNIIYLAFSESSSYDTGAKPDLTATLGAAGLKDVSNSCYINTSTADCLDSTKAVVSTIHVSEMDKAEPLITLAMARPDDRYLFIRFSENVWSETNTPACGSGGQLVAGDFSYSDINLGDASSVVNYDIDNCAETDAFVRMITDQFFTEEDIYNDRVFASTNQIFDASNNAMSDSLESTIVRTVAPYVVTTSSYYNYDTSKYYFRLVFSEPMNHESATTSANYVLTEDTATACTDISSVPLSVNAISSTVFDLESESQCGTGDANETVYSIQATSDIYDYNLIEPVGAPDTATTSGTSSTDATLPRIIQAESTSPFTVQITFSEPMKIGDVLGSAECDSTFVTAATCEADIDSSVTNAQYKYTITPSLGAIYSVVATADPSVFIITHNDRQIGSFYTVTVYADNSATVDDIPEDKWAGNDMQGNPENKATFKGSGEVIDDFGDGTLFDDPFADQTDFSFAFNFNNRVYLGPNNTNSGAFRFEADGSNPVTVTFFAYGVSDCTAARGGSGTFGYGTNPINCLGDAGENDLGPNGERGLVGFNSGEVTVNGEDFDILMVGPIKDNISHAYFTQDIDSELNWTGCTLTNAAGNNTKSVQTTYSFGGNFYVGISSSHNVHSPVMNKFVLSESGGVLSCATGVDLVAKDINYIGKKATSKNPSSNIVGIESMIYIESTSGSINTNDIFYVANNGGLTYWDVTTYGDPSATNNWATAHSFSSGTTLQLSDLGKLRPGQKGIPVLTVYKNAFYLARNLGSAGSPTVNNGAELLKCTTDCTSSANWSVVATSSDFDYDGQTGNGVNNEAIGFIQVNGNNLYLGFDNTTDGITIWRATVDVAAATDFTQQGEAGAGMGSDFPYAFSSSSLNKFGRDYIYITVGKDETAIKVIRQVD